MALSPRRCLPRTRAMRRSVACGVGYCPPRLPHVAWSREAGGQDHGSSAPKPVCARPLKDQGAPPVIPLRYQLRLAGPSIRTSARVLQGRRMMWVHRLAEYDGHADRTARTERRRGSCLAKADAQATPLDRLGGHSGKSLESKRLCKTRHPDILGCAAQAPGMGHPRHQAPCCSRTQEA